MDETRECARSTIIAAISSNSSANTQPNGPSANWSTSVVTPTVYARRTQSGVRTCGLNILMHLVSHGQKDVCAMSSGFTVGSAACKLATDRDEIECEQGQGCSH